MNLISIANDMKGLSDQQLQQQLLQPNGMAPSFVVLGELQRRKEARNDYTARQQGGAPQKSMAEEYAQGIGGQSDSNYANAVKQGEQGGQPPQGMNDPMQSMGQMGQPMGQAPQMPSQQPQGFALGGVVGPARMYDPNTSNFLPYIIKHGAAQPEPITPGPPPILHPEPPPAPTPAPASAPPPVAQGLAVLAQSLGGDGGSGNAAGSDGGGGAGNGAGGGVGTAAGTAAAAAATGEDAGPGADGGDYRWGGGIRGFAGGGSIHSPYGLLPYDKSPYDSYIATPTEPSVVYPTVRRSRGVTPTGADQGWAATYANPNTGGYGFEKTYPKPPEYGYPATKYTGPIGSDYQYPADPRGGLPPSNPLPMSRGQIAPVGPREGYTVDPTSLGANMPGPDEPSPVNTGDVLFPKFKGLHNEPYGGLPAAAASDPQNAAPNAAWPAEPDAPAGIAAARDPNGPAGAPPPQGLRGAGDPSGGGGGGAAGGARGGPRSFADYYAEYNAARPPDRYDALAAENAADKAKLVKQVESDKGMAVFQMGMAMAAGESPNAITNIGRGGMAGAKYWQEAEKEMRQATRDVRNADQQIAIARANRDERGMEMAFKAKTHSEDLASRAADRASAAGIAAGARAAALELKQMELGSLDRNRLELQEQHRIDGFEKATAHYTSQANNIQRDLLRFKSDPLDSADVKAAKEQGAAQAEAELRQLRAKANEASDLYRRSTLGRELRLGTVVMLDPDPKNEGKTIDGKPLRKGQRFMTHDFQTGTYRGD